MTHAYDLGRRAYRDGVALHDNPCIPTFRPDNQWLPVDYLDWRDGWLAEQRSSCHPSTELTLRIIPNYGWGDRVRIG